MQWHHCIGHNEAQVHINNKGLVNHNKGDHRLIWSGITYTSEQLCEKSQLIQSCYYNFYDNNVPDMQTPGHEPGIKLMSGSSKNRTMFCVHLAG